MKTASSDRWVAYLVAATVAVLVLVFGLQRFGIWQPSEVHLADLARAAMNHSHAAMDRPPAQVSFVSMGFHMGGVTELWGRLPSALLAVLALFMLMATAATLGDRRLAVYTGVAYATLPLVYMNARQMLGGTIGQSATTLSLSGLALVLWGRNDRWRLGGALAALLGLALGLRGAGVLVGVVPVLGAAGLAVALRFSREEGLARPVGLALLATGAVLAGVALMTATHALTSYSPWVGAAPQSAPTQWQTFEGYIEQIGHGSFPWTGFALFGILRLVSPPGQAEDGTPDPTLDADESADLDGWREGGLRLMAFLAFALGFAVQTFRMQMYGMTAFAVVAPLALGIGVLLRDCERERVPWRTVAVASGLLTMLMLRDYLQFPRSSYAALGLPDGGPTFPTGFDAKFTDWLATARAARTAGGAVPPIPAEGYFLIETGVFMLFGILVVFQGAGDAPWIRLDRPYRWLIEVEEEYKLAGETERKDNGRRTFPTVLLTHLRMVLAALAVVAIVVGFTVPGAQPGLTTPAVEGLHVLGVSPLLIVGGILGLIVAWDLFVLVGRSGSATQRVLGSRVVLVPLAATLVAVIATQGFVPALSEHMSPRGVWAVVRSLRHGDERVGRYGGPSEDPATRYYTNVVPETITTEDQAVGFLTNSRSFLVVGSDVFPALNKAYRRARHVNVPIADSSNSNLYVAVSDLEGRPDRNPLSEWVLSTPPHPRHPAHEPCHIEDQIDYIGYDLDSNNLAYVPLGGSFRITFNFHVLREPTRNWQIFVHTDGAGPRINGDHEPVGGKYPVRDWLAGDYIRDQINIQIPMTYRPGVYTVYIGFFDGSDRMRVEGGDHDRENRVIAARINVR